MKKSIYIFLALVLFAITFFAFKIVSDDYDKQNNNLSLKIKEIVPIELKNKLKGTAYNLRANINKNEDEKIQHKKKPRIKWKFNSI